MRHHPPTTGDGATRTSRGLVALLVGTTLAFVASGCAPIPPQPSSPTQPEPTTGLPSSSPSPTPKPRPTVSEPLSGLVLLVADQGGTRRLETVTASGALSEIPVPETVEWASMSAEGHLLVTTTTGRLLISAPGGFGGRRNTAFVEVPSAPGSLSMAAISPDGSKAIALASPPLEGSFFRLSVIGLGTRPTGNRVLRVAGQAEGAPIVWLNDERAIVWRRNGVDDLLAAIVDTRTGAAADVEGGTLPISVSGDGRTCAAVGRGYSSLWIGATDAWLAGRGAGSSQVVADPTAVYASAAFDASGQRLAIAITSDGGTSVQVLAETRGAWAVIADRQIVAGDRPLVVPLGWLPSGA